MGGFARTGSRRFSNLRVGRTGRDGRGGTCILCTSSLLVPIRCRTSTGPGHDRMMFHQPSGRGDVERSRPHDPAALRWVAPSSEGTIDQGANGSLDLDYCCKALLGERCFGRSRFRADDRGDRLCSRVGFRGGRTAWVHHRCAALRRRASLVLLVQDEHR